LTIKKQLKMKATQEITGGNSNAAGAVSPAIFIADKSGNVFRQGGQPDSDTGKDGKDNHDLVVALFSMFQKPSGNVVIPSFSDRNM
jgi:hypothetical protein